MAASSYPKLCGSGPVEWVGSCGEGVCEHGADLRDMYLIFYLDNTGDPRVHCGVREWERSCVPSLAVDCYGGSMRVCLRCPHAIVVGGVRPWAATARPEALLHVSDRCRFALWVQDGGP